jgi:hypothetical protein
MDEPAMKSRPGAFGRHGHGVRAIARTLTGALAVLAVAAGSAGAAQRPVLVGPAVKSIESSAKSGVDHRDRFPVFNEMPARADVTLREIDKVPTKTTRYVLLTRWLELHEAVRGWSVQAEPFEDRTLGRLFPNTEFYRLSARSEGLEAVRYGCVSMGEPLVLPEDINLLLVLENRRLNVMNARPLAEVIVRMTDVEGATTMNVVSRTINRDPRTGELAEVVLESWSYNQGLRKRWTLRITEPYVHSLAEKIVAYRPRVLDGLRPTEGTFLDEDDFRGADSGDETYIAFWRSPEERNRMRAIRASWLEHRRAQRGTGSAEETDDTDTVD